MSTPHGNPPPGGGRPAAGGGGAQAAANPAATTTSTTPAAPAAPAPPPPRPPRPEAFEARALKGRRISDSTEEYHIFLQVSTLGEHPVGIKGKFAWACNGTPQTDFETDDSGYAMKRVEAVGNEKGKPYPVYLKLKGTGKEITLLLQTPIRPKYNPGPPPTGESFWARFWYGWRGGRK